MASGTNENTAQTESEQRKLVLEFFKHLSTLCTATIVLMMAIVGTFFPHPMTDLIKALVSLSVIWFLFSIGTSLMSMMVLITNVREFEGPDEWRTMMLFSFVSFLLGLLSIMFTIWIG